MLFVCGVVYFTAFSLDINRGDVDYYFYGLGIILGFVLGAMRSIGRSTYSKLLPETHDHATYFSFYDVTEKIAIVLGMFIFGLLVSMTGSMQYSVLFLAVFFAFAYIVLSLVKSTDFS